MSETVRVTADHIARGKPGDPCGCPVALALNEGHPDLFHVGDDDVLVEGELLGATLPDEAVQFIRAFDRGESVRPFEFTIDWDGPPS